MKKVEKNAVFSVYLESVILLEPEKYQNVSQLLDRCKGLLECKEKLHHRFKKLIRDADTEEKQLEKFKELKMGQTLDYNVRYISDICLTNETLDTDLL